MVVDPRRSMRSRILVGCIGAVLLFCFNPTRADQIADRSQLLAIKEGRSLAAECDLAINLYNSKKTSAIFTKALLAQAQAQLAEAASNLLTSPHASQLVAGASAAISKRDLSELREMTRALLELEQGG
jgi:hypothetical protein